MVGRTLLHYRIVGVLGSGGMGVVYDAEDLKLGRRVALKFLPSELAGDPAALERLQREARAASNLSHPNICTIYAIEHAETDEGIRHFIAMERLEGQSLDQLIAGRPLPVDVVLEIGSQVADALDAAHARGIIHRDIKPANIFVQARHRAKVLDFGLAKAAPARVGMTETVAAGDADLVTSPGTTLGTVAYMSPEQTRGDDLDARSDLFSFGGVLYEMSTGRMPFSGKTSAVIFHKILDKPPEPPRLLNPSLPSRLEEIVLKSLEKDRDLRCQTAAELRADLKRLQRDTTSSHGVSASVPEVAAAPVSASTAPSSGTALIAEARRHKLASGVAALVLFALLGAAAYGVYRALIDEPNDARAEALKITPLTTSGEVRGCVSISPDGRHAVYCETDPTTGAVVLRLRQTATGHTVKLADGGGETTFSQDGNLLYVRRDAELSVVPAIGGEEPQRLLTGVSGPMTVSPVGKQVAFLRSVFLEQSIIIANLDGSGERVLYSVRLPQGGIGSSLAWSPDDSVIASLYRDGPPGSSWSLAAFEVATGKLRKITGESWNALRRVAWLRDGRGLVVSAEQPGETHFQLWLVSYPDGQVTRITNDLHNYSMAIGVSDDDTIVTGQVIQAGDVCISDPSGANLTRVTSGRNAERVVGWTGDTRLIYTADTPGRALWAASLGRTPRSLPLDATRMGNMFIAPGRDWIVYTPLDLLPDIWRVNLDGSGRKQLTHTGRNQNPKVTPDGEWVLYANWGGGSPSTWKVSATGGSPHLLTKAVGRPLPAPDGSRYLGVIVEDAPASPTAPAADARQAIALFRLSDGTREMTVNPPEGMTVPQFLTGGQVQWRPDGRSLVFVKTEGSVSNLWALPVDGGAPHQLTRFETDTIFSYAYSPDGKLLATARGRSSGDVVLIRNFR